MRPSRVVTVVLFGLALLATAGSAGAKSLSAPRYDVHVDVQRDGSVIVTETTEFRFDGGPFRRVFREVPTRRTDGIADVQAWLDEQALPVGTGPGQVEITGRDGRVRVEWHFPETSDATRRFTLRYRAAGVAERTENGDVVAWTVLPRDHDYVIDASHVRVTWPPDLTPLSPPTLSRAATPLPGGEGLAFDVGRVARDRSFEASVTFGPGALTPVIARWQQRRIEQEAMRGTIQLLAAALGLGTLAFFGLLWARVPKAPRETVPADQEPALPEARPVAIASALKAHRSGPQLQDAVAVLLDLARRGHLRIDEVPRPTRLASRRFGLHRTASDEVLAPHERVLLDCVFTDKGTPQPTVDFAGTARRLGRHWSPFRTQVASELSAAGLVDPDRLGARRSLQKLAIVLLVVSGIAIAVSAILFADRWGGWVVVPGAALAAASFVGLLLSQSISPLSDRGAREAARWRAFAGALRQVAKGRQPLGDDERMHRMLPYALAFGVGAALATRLHKEHRALPGWFQALPGDGGGTALEALLSSQAATGHGGGPGGGGGAAGGGSSGAS
jgi:hypothetical protein